MGWIEGVWLSGLDELPEERCHWYEYLNSCKNATEAVCSFDNVYGQCWHKVGEKWAEQAVQNIVQQMDRDVVSGPLYEISQFTKFEMLRCCYRIQPPIFHAHEFESVKFPVADIKWLIEKIRQETKNEQLQKPLSSSTELILMAMQKHEVYSTNPMTKLEVLPLANLGESNTHAFDEAIRIGLVGTERKTGIWLTKKGIAMAKLVEMQRGGCYPFFVVGSPSQPG